MSDESSERHAYAVASLKPFWRWAVALDHRPDLPAIPYYRRADAELFADEYEAAFERKATLLRRRGWFRRVVDVV